MRVGGGGRRRSDPSTARGWRPPCGTAPPTGVTLAMQMTTVPVPAGTNTVRSRCPSSRSPATTRGAGSGRGGRRLAAATRRAPSWQTHRWLSQHRPVEPSSGKTRDAGWNGRRPLAELEAHRHVVDAPEQRRRPGVAVVRKSAPAALRGRELEGRLGGGEAEVARPPWRATWRIAREPRLDEGWCHLDAPSARWHPGRACRRSGLLVRPPS